jgi:hypothetical protein
VPLVVCVTPVATLADDERVVQIADGEAVIDGRAQHWRTVGLYGVADGRMDECWLLPFDQYKFDEIWS